jgi:hypothetical protein
MANQDMTNPSDVERGHTPVVDESFYEQKGTDAPAAATAGDVVSLEDSTVSETKLSIWARQVEKLTGLEARGIHRVPDEEKTAESTLTALQIVLMWFSINTAAQNITLAMIGQEIFELGFVDAALCSIFGGIIGSIPAAYTATFGPISGNRTLVSFIK